MVGVESKAGELIVSGHPLPDEDGTSLETWVDVGI